MHQQGVKNMMHFSKNKEIDALETEERMHFKTNDKRLPRISRG